MRISGKRRDIEIAGSGIGIARTKDGVIKLWADDDLGLARGLGFAHAQDRLVQMDLMRRITARGVPATMIDLDHADARHYDEAGAFLRLEALLEGIDAGRA